MRVERVLHISDTAVTEFYREGGTFVPGIVFEQDDAGLTAFRIYLQREPDKVTAVLVAVAEEEHRIESIPHVRRSEKHAIAARKLGRAFRRTGYRAWSLQGADKRTPKHDRLLLSALTRPATMAPWLELLDECHVPVSGLYSSTAVSKNLLPKLGLGASRTLLATLYHDGRVRHTLFDGTQLVGTRLLPKPAAQANRDPQQIARRLEESLRYFDPSYIPSPGAEIDAVIVADQRITDALGRNLPISDYFICHTFSVQRLAQTLHIPARDGRYLLERILAHLVRTERVIPDYATATTLRYFRMNQARRITRAAALLLALAGFAATSMNAARIVEATSVERQQVQAIDSLTRLTEQDREVLQDLPVEPEQLERSIRTFNTLADRSIDAHLIMRVIGDILNRHPDIRVDEFQWNAEPRSARDDAHIAIVLQGHVAGPDDDVVRAFNHVEAFVRALVARPDIQDVRAVRTPLDTRPQARVTGEFGDGRAAEPAPFEVHMAVTDLHASAGSGS